MEEVKAVLMKHPIAALVVLASERSTGRQPSAVPSTSAFCPRLDKSGEALDGVAGRWAVLSYSYVWD
jgi:hypothetical protein